MSEPWSVDAFLTACASSSNSAFDAFRSLCAELDEPSTRRQARRNLAAALRAAPARGGDDPFSPLHFSVEKLVTSTVENEELEFTLLQFPSIFLPELWSFTFFEGLLRLPQSEFQGRTVVELGCGSGWISIILARRSLPARMIGLDINPRAVICSRLNLYLNGLDDDGRPKLDSEGRSLVDRIEFHESDLLEHCRREGIVPDRVIGCIPQVLSPDPAATLEDLRGSNDDASLHALSNYYVPQGNVEDEFGLGLIARALEESIVALKPSGKVILNLGGRPGRRVLERLFARRGMKTRLVWATKVEQAGDTEISPLVEIEKESPHRFEFYMGVASDEPICAGTAQRYAAAGGTIAHDLLVMEGVLRQPQATKRIFKALAGPTAAPVRSRIDLEFEDDGLLEEKSSFLAAFLEKLEAPQERLFGYEDTEGHAPFRRRIAEYLRSYWRVPLAATSVHVLPTRADALMNLCRLYRPKTLLADAELLREVQGLSGPGGWDGFARTEVFEAPRKAENVAKLVQAIAPELVVASVPESERDSMDALERLFEATATARARLLLDISSLLELRSDPPGNAVARYLSERRLPAHVVLVAGLIRNRVYRDLQVAIVLSECAETLDALVRAAELTFSRVPSLPQLYYDQILADLLSFQLRHREKAQSVRLPVKAEDGGKGFVRFAPDFEKVRHHPAVESHAWPLTKETIRFDYGENVFPPPPELRTGLAISLAKKQPEPARARLDAQIARRLDERFGIPWADLGCAFGSGVAPLFAGLAERCAQEGASLLVPTGCYGHFDAAARFLGVDVRRVPGARARSFKPDPAGLDAALSASAQAPWIYLNLPAVNPTGALYETEEVAELLAWADKKGATVIFDTIFSGLEFDPKKRHFPLGTLLARHPGLHWVLLGGISKECAAGGLRFGFGVSAHRAFIAAMDQGSCGKPHALLVNALASAFETGGLVSAINPVLAARAQELCAVLTECGWDALPPKGGLFLVATPRSYFGKPFVFNEGDGTKKELPLDASNIDAALFQGVGLHINNDVWTGIPGYCRFVLSVTDPVFDQGLAKLRAFAALALGPHSAK